MCFVPSIRKDLDDQLLELTRRESIHTLWILLQSFCDRGAGNNDLRLNTMDQPLGSDADR
jgi:hypothetical protein